MTCGTIAAADYPRFLQVLAKLEAKQAAATGAKGHAQRTPACLHALAVQALRAGGDGVATEAVRVRGGFTDVGRQAGGEARDTCWPLVREVLRVRK